MARYRKILVAFDGSTSARNALVQISRMAKEDKSWIKVLAVIPPYEGDLELVGVPNIKETITGSGQKLLALARQIADEQDVHILADLGQGEPYERIVHVAEEENCDLIVMGRLGQSHVEREFMGSVTARVIGHTSRDVLVIPEETEVSWSKIVLATDGSKYSDAAVDRAIDLAQKNNAGLTAVSVVDVNEEFYANAPEALGELITKARATVEEAKKKAESAGITTEALVKEGESHRVITELARDIGASLIIMGSHGRKGLTRLLMGSVTERVIGFAPCPVMVSHLQG